MARSSKDIAKRLRFDLRPRPDAFRRWYLAVGLAACLLGAAVPSLVVAVGVRWGFRSAAEDQDDYMLVQLLNLGNDAVWLPLRNYTILCLLGLGVVMVGLTLVLLETRQRTMRSAAGVDNGGSGK